MAVETHNLHHLFPSQLLTCREVSNSTIENQSNNINMQMGFVSPDSCVPAGVSLLPPYNPLNAGITYRASTADNGLIVSNLPDSRKRPRDCGPSLSFLGDDISALVHHQLVDIDNLISRHAEKVRIELIERRKQFLREMMVAVEGNMSKRLKTKQEEIDRMVKLNWALQERIKSLLVENQLWRELAQSNEATANMLRSNLEHVLAAQLKLKEEQDGVQAAAAIAEDEESCCHGDNRATEERQQRVCMSCRNGEPAVVVLPCRHLCLCVKCEMLVDACPACNGRKSGSLLVNMS